MKTYVHFDMMMLLFVNCMPSYLKLYDRNYVTVLEMTMILLCVHFNYKSSIISLIVNRLIYALLLFVIYEESSEAVFGVFAWSILQIAMVLCLVHLTLTSIG